MFEGRGETPASTWETGERPEVAAMGGSKSLQAPASPVTPSLLGWCVLGRAQKSQGSSDAGRFCFLG